MNTSITAIPTTYAGVNFRSRLEARYAAFFDIVGWKWEYEPVDLEGWIPDFRITIPCAHCDCRPDPHVLLVEAKPYYRIDDFSGTPEYELAMEASEDFWAHRLPCDAVALFGIDPSVSYCEIGSCGAPRGHSTPSIPAWVDDWADTWKQAGNMVQWHRPEQPVAWRGNENVPPVITKPRYHIEQDRVFGPHCYWVFRDQGGLALEKFTSHEAAERYVKTILGGVVNHE